MMLTIYNRLKKAFKNNQMSENVTNLFIDIQQYTTTYLDSLRREVLDSRVPNKEYFSFFSDEKNFRSRPINTYLFDSGRVAINEFWEAVKLNNLKILTPDQITGASYYIVISFCASIDTMKKDDNKTPGTYFEMFIGHILSKVFGKLPVKELDVLNIGRETKLPTDFIFDLGEDQPKFHVPCKTSTRERVIQVWAHQKILDGVYGFGRFIGMLLCLAETKLDSENLQVTEICLPDQWRVYQLFIAQLKRIYYLDIPAKYSELNNTFPKIHAKPFGYFFHELESFFE